MSQTGLFYKTKQLFFIKRRPRFHVPLAWQQPETEEAYARILQNEGFIARSFWTADDIASLPRINQDLNDLEEHLLPTFFEFNQKARHYQNRYYLYQWIFMLGALATTMFGASTTYTYVVHSDASFLPEALGYATAIISGLTAFFNVLSTQGSPQQRWAKTRRLAEELRMMYFTYVAHLEPFNTNERVQRLREQVLKVRRKEYENV